MIALVRPPSSVLLPPLMSAALLVRCILWLWFFAAVLAGNSLVLQRLPPFAVPGLVLTLTAFVLALYFFVAPLRAWADTISLRRLVLLHVTRFVGIAFLVLYQRGELPYAFAVPGGIGDIVVATFALPVALAPLAPDRLRRAMRIWNMVGLVDITLVVLTAIRLNLADPTQMRALTQLPLALLPTFLVPLIIATHVIIFVRLARDERPA
jgi:hypothetical protein